MEQDKYRILLFGLDSSSNFETVGICTFFEAPSIGCGKTTCDVTKVTDNMYSCYTYCMSRERMEMDDRDRATCQNLEEGTQMEL